ncbi:MAG TPA: hypothetical protein DCW83_01190 [Saprospirales bacterium]|nr:hypothetical protein [Saprospirales bacterium]
MNYSKEITADIVKRYRDAPNRQTVAILAKELGKSEKSVIGKLSKEGVYKRSVYVTKAGEKPVTKAQLVQELEEKLDANLEGLEKAPKETLRSLVEAICEE